MTINENIFQNFCFLKTNKEQELVSDIGNEFQIVSPR